MKTIAIWIGALVLGFIGGIAGQRFSAQSVHTELTSSTRARTFELADPSGRVVSVWTTDRWGRPFIGFSDSRWEGRVVVGSIEQSDVVTNTPPGPNTEWGISVTAPSHAAHAILGTGISAETKKPAGFAAWK